MEAYQVACTVRNSDGGICTMLWWVNCLIKKGQVMKRTLFSLIIGEQSEEAKHRLVSLKGEINGAKCKWTA
jgi:hypothetical protein